MRLKAILLVLLALSFVPTGASSSRSDEPAPMTRSSSAIAITSDGATLLAVNPDSNSVSLIDMGTLNTVTEVPVGKDPRTVAVDDAARRAYVANRGSNSISVLDLQARRVITEVIAGDRPYGVVLSPDGERLYVAEQGIDRLSILDTVTFETIARLSVTDRPSGLAISADGRSLYVTHLLNNAITLINVRPHSLYLPLVLQIRLVKWYAGILTEGGQANAGRFRDLPTQQLVNYHSTAIPLWPDSNLVQSMIISPDGQHAYVPHTRSNSGNQALTFDTTVLPLVALIDLTAQRLLPQKIDLGTLDPPGVGLPFDAAITPDGQELWVLNAASNDISVVDAVERDLIAHIQVGDNPRGIVLSPDGTKAYVNNTLAGTVSVLSTINYTVTTVITVTDIPLPPVLLQGKRLFHSSDDPRLSLAQWISCNTCHFEGEHDGRTWVFGFAGPRNTTSLLGMVETYPLRWSGEWDESADSEFANRKENFGSGLIDGELNCSLSPPDCLAPAHSPNQGRSGDLDALAAFIDSLKIEPSPSHAQGEPLTEAEQRGQASFENPALDCVTCHPPPLYTDHQAHDVGTATTDEQIGPDYDTPSLRGLYDSAPYFHDGSAATLYDALTRPSDKSEHDVRASLMENEIHDMIAFLLAIPFE